MRPEVKNLVTSKKPLVIVPVVLALVLAGLFLPVREVSIEPYGTLSLESKITISIGYEVAYASPGWVSPTGFVDPGTEWTGETNAYDEDIETYAVNTIPGASWSNYLELTIDAINCDKVRYYFGEGTTNIANCEIDVYYALGWVNIFAGLPTFKAWTEVNLGSTQSVTSARIKFSNSHPNKSREAWVYEFDFNELPPLSNTPTEKDFDTVSTSTDYWSSDSPPNWTDGLGDTECFFTVTNNSSSAVDIAIRATDFSGGIASGGWDLGDPAFADTVRLRAGKSGDASEGDMFVLTTSDQLNFISGLLGLPNAPDNTKKWELKMETPTSFSNGDPKTSTVTLTAMFP